jgi:ribosome-associated protein
VRLVTARDALVVNEAITIPQSELIFRATRSGGPGGQHVNTSSTRVELLWPISTSRAVDDATRALLAERLASRLDGEGNVRVVASEFRSQAQNRERAEVRLADLVRRALVVQKKRKATKPTRAAKEARLEDKRRRGTIKRERRKDDDA